MIGPIADVGGDVYGAVRGFGACTNSVHLGDLAMVNLRNPGLDTPGSLRAGNQSSPRLGESRLTVRMLRRERERERLLDTALVGLADAIEALRAELTQAIIRGGDKSMRFALEPIELTVQAVVTKDVDGRIGWSVLGVGGKYETARTQAVTLKLSPLWRKSDGTLTADFTVGSLGATGDTVGPHN